MEIIIGNNQNSGAGTTTDKTGGQTGAQNSGQAGKVDTTLSPTKLPKTGKAILMIFIGVTLLIGIAVFIRYEFLNKYVK